MVQLKVMEILVFKSLKRLDLLNDKGELVRSFPIGIGKDPSGHKRREGDFKTPEGHYQVCVKNPKSKFHLSLGLNYPNQEDALMGLSEGALDDAQYSEILQRLEEGRPPLWNTALGGQIYIHGDLESRDWSEGCIRMFNPDIEYLFSLAENGTKVTILP